MYSWLAADPTGRSFEWKESGDDPLKDVVMMRMLLDPAISCEKSFARVEPEAIRYVVAHGHPGIGDLVNRDGIWTQVSTDGKGTVIAPVNKPVSLGYAVPEDLRRGMDITSILLVNDARAFVVTMFDAKEAYHILVFRKRDKTWHFLPQLSEKHPFVQGFGEYLALTEVQTKTANRPLAAGMDRWIPGENRVHPDLRERLADMDSHDHASFPGILHLYNVDTEQVLSISTKQGDSEVLLVEDGIVYYRAADQLFSAPILRDRIGPSRLLATDDAIRDAHWAFIKH